MKKTLKTILVFAAGVGAAKLYDEKGDEIKERIKTVLGKDDDEELSCENCDCDCELRGGE